jgi:hypothetical protein
MTRKDKKTIKMCERICNDIGRAKFFDYINDNIRLKEPLFKKVKYEFCEACDCDSPAINHICLCCGQPTKVVDDLVDRVIEEIERDILNGDLTAVDELLKFIPTKNLIAFLPEEEWEKYK